MLVLSLSLSLSFIFPPCYVCLSVVRSAVLHLDLDFTTKAAHLSFSSLLFSSLPCFAPSPLGWFLHQPRQELILEFCPWFPPISPRAVTCQCCPPLGSPSCCNYLWHPGSGAFHTGDMVEGGGWVQKVERRKGRFFLCSRQSDVRGAADLPAIAEIWIQLYSLQCTPLSPLY